jgi:hypothetical protein
VRIILRQKLENVGAKIGADAEEAEVYVNLR